METKETPKVKKPRDSKYKKKLAIKGTLDDVLKASFAPSKKEAKESK